jgi:penicillin-binding protein 2
MPFRNYGLLVSLLLFLSLTACETLLPANAPEGAAAPAIQLLPQTPEDVAVAFLNAWGQRDYATMYSLIAPQSQSLTSSETFAATYEADDTTLAQTGVTHVIDAVMLQGTTAVIAYAVTIQSSVYGDIVDEDRTMRLIETSAGWRVAWSRMDVFDRLVAGALLETVTDRAPRGNIYGRNDELLVEQDGTVVTVYLQRINIFDEVACLDLLASAMARDYDSLVALLDQYNSETIVPIGDLDLDQYNALEPALIDNCSIQSITRTTRNYIGHGAAVHVTGAIAQIQQAELDLWLSRGYDTDDLIGRDGIERQYEIELAGQAERILRIREPGGTIIREIARARGTPPQDVRLTIDVGLQLATARALADAFNYAAPNWAEQGRSSGAGAVVIDVNTGAVLAMASFPMYDPGIFNPDTQVINVGNYILELQGDSVGRPFFNRATQEQYPPGSTFKIITTTAALAERVTTPDTIFYCDLAWAGGEFGDTVAQRTDWRILEPPPLNVATGDVTPALALASSCNPFYYEMGALLFRRGPTVLMDYARRMGLGAPTGLDLNVPPEVNGQIPPVRAVDEAINTAIGQGNLQVSILQMAHMVGGVATGTLYEPYIVQQVGDGAPTQPVGTDMGISDEVLTVVRSGMCEVTTNTTLGTAWRVFGDFDNNVPSTQYIACGKTGTAQTSRVEPHGWFVAYAPADNPQIAIAVMVENSREGSETAAPIVRRILDYYFDVPPELRTEYPGWWRESYVPLTIPEGMTGG